MLVPSKDEPEELFLHRPKVNRCQPAAAEIALDTNILACYFLAEGGADATTQTQRQATRQLIESGQDVFLPKTVAQELRFRAGGGRSTLRP